MSIFKELPVELKFKIINMNTDLCIDCNDNIKHLSNHLDSESYIDSNGKNYSQLCGLFREMSVRAYKLTEYVMTNKLGYVPIPGYYDGNVDV